MKIEFVEVAGFRGFREKTRVEFPSGFLVICGRNGVGKSTILDAIDFAITGTINKFPVTSAKGGGLSDHIWWVGNPAATDHYVTVGFRDSEANSFSITRRRDVGLVSNVDDLVLRLCGQSDNAPISLETLIQTTLIRDETLVSLSIDLPGQARFAAVKAAIGGLIGRDYSTRTKAIVEAAESTCNQQRERLQGVQAALSRELTALTEARSVAEQSKDIATAQKIIDELGIVLPSAPSPRLEALRGIVVDQRAALQELERARVLSEIAVAALRDLNSEQSIIQEDAAKAVVESTTLAVVRARNVLEQAQRLADVERDNDEFAAHLLSVIEHGEIVGLQEGHCPLCDAMRSQEEFRTAISSTRARLADRTAEFSKAAVALNNAQRDVEAAQLESLGAVRQLEAFQERRQELEQTFETVGLTYDRLSFAASSRDPDEAQKLLLAQQEATTRLERSLLTLEASSAIDRVATLESRISALRVRLDEEAVRLSGYERIFGTAHQIDAAAKNEAIQMLTEQFDTIMPLLRELYRRLRPYGEWAEIDADFGGKVRGSLNFLVGDGHNVQFLFSSGQRRAAGLAFLLAIHLSRRWCKWESLLLDDPVQHIDDYRALNLVEVLSAVRRSGRQIVIAVEDTALADVLCRRLRSSVSEKGCRIDLATSKSGAAEIVSTQIIVPMPREVLKSA